MQNLQDALLGLLNSARHTLDYATEQVAEELPDELWDGHPLDELRTHADEIEDTIMGWMNDNGYRFHFDRSDGTWKVGSPTDKGPPMNEQTIEQDLVDAGKDAPRLTPDSIDGVIKDVQHHVFPGTTLTVCAITLKNGFVVTGTSAAASPANFDEHIGRQIAFAKAREKIWDVEGYLLRERIYKGRV